MECRLAKSNLFSNVTVTYLILKKKQYVGIVRKKLILLDNYQSLEQSCIETWCRRWHVKVNGAKSAHLTFTLRRKPTYVTQKSIDRKFDLLCRLLNKSSKNPLHNKLTIYEGILKPTSLSYGVQLSQLTSNASILRIILNAPWNVSNRTTYNDLKIPIKCRSPFH